MIHRAPHCVAVLEALPPLLRACVLSELHKIIEDPTRLETEAIRGRGGRQRRIQARFKGEIYLYPIQALGQRVLLTIELVQLQGPIREQALAILAVTIHGDV